MLKKMIVAGLILAMCGFQAMAQDDTQKVVITGELTTIYTLGNATIDQKIDDPNAAGAYFNDPAQQAGTRKNGFYNAANLYATLRPFSGLEGYFKLYSIHRPGSFYHPLSMENLGREDSTNQGGAFLAVKLDAVYGKVSVFETLQLDMPFSLSLKAGRYKAQAAQFGIVSKYRTEQVLYMMNTKTDFTYELGLGITDPFKLDFFAVTNYLFNESVPRYYDEDGAVKHGNLVLNEYAPQFLMGFQLRDFNNLSAELLYGQNVSNIYSGHAAGFSGRYDLKVSDDISIPVGLSFAFHEKNIDLLSQTALATPDSANNTTLDFRNSLGGALGAGLRLGTDLFDFEFNLAGSLYAIQHIYRTDLTVVKLSADTMFTLQKNYFLGAGLVLGSLTDAEWKTTDEARAQQKETDYENTFALAENMGFEVYGGINLRNAGKFVIGFNLNKGISLNNMLEARHEGQMKYKQLDTSWAQDRLAEAGGLYFKFYFRF